MGGARAASRAAPSGGRRLFPGDEQLVPRRQPILRRQDRPAVRRAPDLLGVYVQKGPNVDTLAQHGARAAPPVAAGAPHDDATAVEMARQVVRPAGVKRLRRIGGKGAGGAPG